MSWILQPMLLRKIFKVMATSTLNLDEFLEQDLRLSSSPWTLCSASIWITTLMKYENLLKSSCTSFCFAPHPLSVKPLLLIGTNLIQKNECQWLKYRGIKKVDPVPNLNAFLDLSLCGCGGRLTYWVLAFEKLVKWNCVVKRWDGIQVYKASYFCAFRQTQGGGGELEFAQHHKSQLQMTSFNLNFGIAPWLILRFDILPTFLCLTHSILL